jgi:hypothetical protein
MDARAAALLTVIANRAVKQPTKLAPSRLQKLFIFQRAHRTDNDVFHRISLV